ncbi:MAG: C10 family peptidase [Planctomycetota bacterium]
MKRSSQVRNPGRHVKLRPLIMLAFSVSLFLCSSNLWAKPVSAGEAEKVVRGWLKADAQPLGTALGQDIMSVKAFSDENGDTVYYAVYLQPSGFVIVPGDDLVEPIICFVPVGRYDPSEDNPLVTLVSRDVPGRVAVVRAFHAAAGSAAQKDAGNEETALQQTSAKAQSKWNELQTYADSVGILGLSSVSDVRVAPLTQSTWGQTTVGDYIGGITCYNYYIVNNWPIGCVAAAMAQLMRYHEWPGYTWSDMPLQPDSGITLTERQAIGALCYHAAESINTTYGSGGSSASPSDAKQALQDTFYYNNSIYGWYNNNNIGAGLNRMVNPNLDASYPVILSVGGSSVGHAVVCDGYGYNVSTLYHHLNMGWSGTDNAWYNLPVINATFTYNSVDGCIYNIFTSGSGEIISGRAVDMAGFGISGVSITATGGGTYLATTNTQGIYALVNVPSNTSFTVSASKPPHTFTNQNTSTGQSSDWSSTSGNAWGVNFTSSSSTPPTAYNQTTSALSGTAEMITLAADDEGNPNPPGQLTYIISSLPANGTLTDPGASGITMVPYTLVNNGNAVDYKACPFFAGQDTFEFKANDGGTPPQGGDSGPATVIINVDNAIYTTFEPQTNLYATWPIDTYYHDQRTQVIYLSSEIGDAKTITDLALNVYHVPGQFVYNWTIRMKHTSRSDYSYPPYFETSGWTPIYQYQNNESISSPGWRNFHFQNAFEYNGTDNLLIDFSYNNSSFSTESSCMVSDMGVERVLMAFCDSTHGNPLNWSDSYNPGLWGATGVPNIKFISEVSAEPMPGDFKPDCKVNMFDVSVFALAWKSRPGDSNWDADCDLYATTEPVIDMRDVSVFVGYWLDYFE